MEGSAGPLTVLNEETEMPAPRVGGAGLWRDRVPAFSPSLKETG